MKKPVIFALLMLGLTIPCLSQEALDRDETLFKVALPSHPGRLEWRAEGFKIIQVSAKPNGVEIGLRGRDATGRLTLLGFLFIVTGKSELTSANCRDQALAVLNKDNSTFKTLSASELPNPGGLPVGGQTVIDPPNDHLRYALTWFGLAAALIVIYIVCYWHRER